MDCRTIMTSAWYQTLFPLTRLSSQRQALQEFVTTRQGSRLSTSVGGVLTGRGADYLIVDDALKPDEALSETQRKAVNDWYDHTLYSRLNDKKKGRIVVVMQRLHEDDLVGHVLGKEPWKAIRFPAIAEEDETHVVETPYGTRRFERRTGEALHVEREPLEILAQIRERLGEYNFAGQYQQAPAPLGGGMVKAEWFRFYAAADVPERFEMTFQSWDSANKPTQLGDFSVCTTWGVKEKQIYLLHVYRKRLGYPELKRAVQEQAMVFHPKTILIEDKASGTQLIQELISEGMYAIKRYEPEGDKIMRMHSVTSTIENGLVYLPDKAAWLGEYLHELTSFPKGRFNDQVDSTSQALDWFKKQCEYSEYGLLEFYNEQNENRKAGRPSVFDSPLTSRGAALREWDRTRGPFGRF
jgi:predicted phage terminase large subunit-like protein